MSGAQELSQPLPNSVNGHAKTDKTDKTDAAQEKSVIRVTPGEIHNIADRAEKELAESGRYYQRSGLIVVIRRDPGTRETFVQNISQPALTAALAGVATWERFDKRSENWVRIDPPARHVAIVSDAAGYRHLPVLKDLVRQPYLRPDGSLATISGYDRVTGMYGIFDPRKFFVPDRPTREDAQTALESLLALLEEFPFTASPDKAAALSAILTAAIRPSLSAAPMYHVRAPIISSGKTFLCRVISIFATPQRGAPATFPKDDEECRKLLLSELLRSPAVIEFDNLTGDLAAHKSLCATLTSEYMSGRILGVSKMATVSTRTLFLSSGNNVGPVQDMTRRCITINLDPGCELPAARAFKNPDLLSGLYRDRERHVSAALTIIRAWIEAGRPKQQCRPLASYDEWSDFCRQPLLWLGQPDPTESVFEAMTDDPDRDTLDQLLRCWKEVFGKRAAMVREAVKLITHGNNEELKAVLEDIALERDGTVNQRILGRWIKRHEKRIVDGRRFVRAGGSRSAAAWHVESVT